MQYRRWLNNIDYFSLVALIVFIALGFLLVVTASPTVAERIDIAHFHFIHRQLIFILLAFPIILFLTLLSRRNLVHFCLVGFFITVLLLLLLPLFGDETKGARRWMTIAGFSLQPSEFLKPFYAVIVARFLSIDFTSFAVNKNWKFFIILPIHIIISVLLFIQPDFGMMILISSVTIMQVFVAGLPWVWIFFIGLFFIIGAFVAYLILPHVSQRISLFLSGDITNSYQIKRSIESYVNGGLLGRGPGEGQMKYLLPDAHTDFIFAVAGEEFGVLFCIVLVCLIAFIVLRGMLQLRGVQDRFNVYIGVAMIGYFALQSIFNIGVTLHLFPTKGMTLPFVSYGGSSILSFAIALGIYFNITRLDYRVRSISRMPHIKMFR